MEKFMTRKHIANCAIVGLVGMEIAMGFASTTPDVPAWVQTLALVAMLLFGSALQATLLPVTLLHRRNNSWRQIPSIAMQVCLFLMIAWWAHKGLGNTIFQGWSEWQLVCAGGGLGLLTMFGPEIVNYDSYPEKADQDAAQDALDYADSREAVEGMMKVYRGEQEAA